LTAADYDRASITAVSFNSGLVWRATDNDTFRLMLARGVQLPSLVDFGVQVSAGDFGPIAIVGNPDLHPSTVDNLELDYDREIRDIGSTLRLALFAQRTRDVISEPYSAVPAIGRLGFTVLTPHNIGGTNAVGGEIGLKGHSASGFRWTATYAFVATTANAAEGVSAITTNPIDYANAAPRHVVTAAIGYTHDRLELDLMARWQSAYVDLLSVGVATLLRPVSIDGYVTLNARAGYRLTDNLTLALTAQQFNTSRLLQVAGPPIERRVIASVTAHF
jgi:iron complex outermembrane receptor protein